MNWANRLTMFRLILIPIFVVFTSTIPEDIVARFHVLKFINTHGIYVGVAIFVIAAITDKLDGYIARKYNQVTKFGIFLDPLADKIMITVALFILVQRHDIAGWIALIIIGREIIVTGFRLAAAQKRVILAADKFGKIKMVAQVVAVLLALLNNYPLRLVTSVQFDDTAIIIAVVLTVLSGVNYIIKNQSVFIEA